MRVITGKVVSGKVVVEGEPLREGATVTVLAVDEDDQFELGPEEASALVAAIGEADRGEVVDAERLLAELSAQS